MSVSSSTARSLPTGDGNSVPVSAAEIDASCRGPVLFLFVSAAVWLLVSSIFGMIATLKFHMPNLLADCPWFTYGRVHPAHMNALIYGFAMQAGLGVVLWMFAHLGRTRLAFSPVIVVGGILWNTATLLGVGGILYGESTGYEWLEMPRYASVILFAGYVLVALGAMVTLHERRERSLYTSQWFALAALFWFPWIFSTAEIQLVAHPVRGALQAAIDWWYMNNLKTVWFGLVGLASIFYFVPKIIERPLYSHYISIFVFWTIMLFGSWGGIPHGSPLPAWMSAMSTMGLALTMVPVLAVAVNLRKTMSGNCSKLRECRSLKYFLFGGMAYVIYGLLAGVTSIMKVARFTNFTWFVPAQAQLVIYGFFAIVMLGSIYYIVPKLVAVEFPKPGMICFNFLLAGGGVFIYWAALTVGGIKEGFAFNDASYSFMDAMLSSLMFFRISTLGDLLMLLGHLVLLLNLAGILWRVGRPALDAAKNHYTTPVEVAR